MTQRARAGDRIVVDSHKAGEGPREGELLEVIQHDYGTSYRVRWSDGHESTFRPTAGTTRIISRRATAKR
jgi:hypothetical protein